MPAESPLVSIALCTWNGAHWLRPQLDSILAQQDVRLELVALDDASSDDSLAILHAYAARDPRVRVYANPGNLGHLRSFEKCMAMCDGEFVAPADQDDVWHPDKLRRLLDAIGRAALAYGDSRYIDADGRAIGRSVSDDLRMLSGGDPLPFLLQNTVSGHAALLRRDVVRAALPFPAAGFHDWWLALVAAAHGGIVHVDAPLVDFRRHARSSSRVGRYNQSMNGASRGTREAAWLDERASLAEAFVERFRTTPDVERISVWAQLLRRLSKGDAQGIWSVCIRDRYALGGTHRALARAASLMRKAHQECPY